MSYLQGGISPRRRRTNKGSVLVETALIFLVFASMLIGAFDFAQFLFMHQALVERARSAARWGAINGPTNSNSITNMVLYNQATTPAAGTASYFNLASTNVSVATADSGTDNYRLTVQISGYSFSALTPDIAGTYFGPPVTVSVPLGLYN